MRIFYAFLILLVSAVLWMLPVTEGIYDFRTDVREDKFTVLTAAGVSNSTVQLFTDIYDNDTSTIDLSSNDGDDTPTYSSYNSTTRNLVVIGLSANTTRTLSVFYDIDALTESAAVGNLLDMTDMLWLLIIIAFPGAAIVAIVTMRERG